MEIKQFANKNKITMTAEMTDRNLTMTEDSWSKRADHWKCLLKHGKKRMTIYFSMGPALCREPTIEDVLNDLKLNTADEETFENWASNYGYDSDSRKAHQTWKVCWKQAWKFRQFLGQKLLEELRKCESL